MKKYNHLSVRVAAAYIVVSVLGGLIVGFTFGNGITTIRRVPTPPTPVTTLAQLQRVNGPAAGAAFAGKQLNKQLTGYRCLDWQYQSTGTIIFACQH